MYHLITSFKWQMILMGIMGVTLVTSWSQWALGADTVRPIHHSPIILKAEHYHYLVGFPIDQYRLIKNDNGVAKIIPFQIDEQTNYTDYVLNTAVSELPLETSDGIFSHGDELVYMGQDTGAKSYPKIWNFQEPEIIYRVDGLMGNMEPSAGAVFVAIYPDPNQRPPLSSRRYVDFDLNNSSIISSKYIYEFDPKNYMVVRQVSLKTPAGKLRRFIDKSSFYLKSDFKYFLTFKVGHSDLQSTLEAYKSGPIRTIIRVSFAYVFLKLNFKMGMYTEVSFFENSIMLPTILHNPLDGNRTLNPGSGFYYGLGMPYNVALLNPKSNMQPYPVKPKLFGQTPKVFPLYQLNIDNDAFLLNLIIEPSLKMIRRGNNLQYYLEPGNPDNILQRKWNKALPLGQAPVNLAVYFDLHNFAAGVHRIGFQLFIDNETSPDIRQTMSNIHNWHYRVLTADKFLPPAPQDRAKQPANVSPIAPPARAP